MKRVRLSLLLFLLAAVGFSAALLTHAHHDDLAAGLDCLVAVVNIAVAVAFWRMNR